MSRTVRILGIDPGSQITGFGIVDVVGTQSRPVHWGGVQANGDHSRRLKEIFQALGDIVREHRPTEIAIERVFIHRNADSALKLGQARAAALCATFDADLPIYEYSPRHIKKAVVGRGAADKSQVQHMVRMILGIRGGLEADAADALAAALCHAHERTANRCIQQAAQRS